MKIDTAGRSEETRALLGRAMEIISLWYPTETTTIIAIIIDTILTKTDYNITNVHIRARKSPRI